MRFDIALIPSLLLASAVVAGHGYHSVHHQTRSSNGVPGDPNTKISGTANNIWAGAVLEGSFYNVTGTFPVPNALDSESAAAFIAVGIDGGPRCKRAALHVGISIEVGPNGEVSYSVWYKFFPGKINYFSGISINRGDIIECNVSSMDGVNGIVEIVNLTTKQSQTKYLSSTVPLCGAEAVWVVEGATNDSHPVLLPNISTVIMVNSRATGHSGKGNLSDANIYYIGDENKPQSLTEINSRASIILIYVE